MVLRRFLESSKPARISAVINSRNVLPTSREIARFLCSESIGPRRDERGGWGQQEHSAARGILRSGGVPENYVLIVC